MFESRVGRKIPAFVKALLLVAPAAFARAGGGESFGGSGGGGDWGGGGGDGLGIIFYYLARLVVTNPLIGIPLVIVGIVVVTKFGKSARAGSQYRTIVSAGKAAGARRQADRSVQLEGLKARDAAFSDEDFLKRSTQAFLEIQKAWSDQDMSKASRFISDGIRERFEMQIAMQKAEGWRNRMENLLVLDTAIASATSDSFYDGISVEIRAQARDLEVSLDSGKVIRTREAEQFSEIWSFLRRPGVVTKTGPGLIEGFCPNCGASLELTDARRCQNCDSLVTSGQYDWVLSEVTQSSEWKAEGRPELVPGFAEMAGRDPAFNLQHIEDRASVIFWRYVRSHFDGSSSPMRKVATPSFLEGFGKSLALAREGGWWLYFRDAAVGGVDIQRIVPGQNGPDRIDALVRWSARNAQKNAEGRSRSEGDRMIRPSVFVLVRNPGVLSPAGMSFMSAHCQGCGAPDTGGDSGACDYCGRVLNDGGQDWVLQSVERFDPSTVRAAQVRTVEKVSLVPPEVLLASMASTMFADGEVGPGEEECFREFASTAAIPSSRADEILASVRAGHPPIPPVQGRDQAAELLGAMARIALADGRLSAGETKFLEEFASSVGLSRADVSLIVARQRSALASGKP